MLAASCIFPGFGFLGSSSLGAGPAIDVSGILSFRGGNGKSGIAWGWYAGAVYSSRLEEARLKAEDENVFAACGHDRAAEAVANALKNMADAAVEGRICAAAMVGARLNCRILWKAKEVVVREWCG